MNRPSTRIVCAVFGWKSLKGDCSSYVDANYSSSSDAPPLRASVRIRTDALTWRLKSLAFAISGTVTSRQGFPSFLTVEYGDFSATAVSKQIVPVFPPARSC
mmetsp:Transcript_36310/g.108971  ORF Transcript_36310/g.108971 Transcript_36310/m.108971 type:complete len:102 (-) Transcript_36310:3174-3479(-)